MNASNIRGYRFIDKAMDAPVKEQAIGRKKSTESDVFDGLSTCTPGTLSRQQNNVKSSESDIFDGLDYSEDNVNIVSPEKGLRAVPAHGFVDGDILKKSNTMPSKISNNVHVISPHRTHSSGRSNMKNQSPRALTKKNHNKSLHFATSSASSTTQSIVPISNTPSTASWEEFPNTSLFSTSLLNRNGVNNDKEKRPIGVLIEI